MKVLIFVSLAILGLVISEVPVSILPSSSGVFDEHSHKVVQIVRENVDLHDDLYSNAKVQIVKNTHDYASNYLLVSLTFLFKDFSN